MMFQKLNFDEIYDCVKEAKIKCSKSRLTDFLDEQVSIHYDIVVYQVCYYKNTIVLGANT